MTYVLRLSSDAGITLVKLPKALRAHLLRHLRKLADNPSSFGYPSHFPYPPDCQLSRPEPMKHEGEKHDFMVLFRYAPDEASLQIIGIGHTVVE
jgi:hypothetical protein